MLHDQAAYRPRFTNRSRSLASITLIHSTLRGVRYFRAFNDLIYRKGVIARTTSLARIDLSTVQQLGRHLTQRSSPMGKRTGVTPER